MPLVGLEMGERARGRLHPLAPGADLCLPVDDQHPGVLLDLMVAELLAGIEPDEDGASLVLALQDDGRAAPIRGLDVGQIPGFHGASSVTRPG